MIGNSILKLRRLEGKVLTKGKDAPMQPAQHSLTV